MCLDQKLEWPCSNRTWKIDSRSTQMQLFDMCMLETNMVMQGHMDDEEVMSSQHSQLMHPYMTCPNGFFDAYAIEVLAMDGLA